jgi:hypothetical protein
VVEVGRQRGGSGTPTQGRRRLVQCVSGTPTGSVWRGVERGGGMRPRRGGGSQRAGLRSGDAAHGNAREATSELGDVEEVALDGGQTGWHAVERPSSSARERVVAVVLDAVAYEKIPLDLEDDCSIHSMPLLRRVWRCSNKIIGWCCTRSRIALRLV